MATLLSLSDLCIRGVWVPQAEALFGICIVVWSYHDHTPLAVLCSAEHNKKLKYSQACQDRKATFTPLVLSVDGMIGCEAAAFFRRIADLLSAK